MKKYKKQTNKRNNSSWCHSATNEQKLKLTNLQTNTRNEQTHQTQETNKQTNEQTNVTNEQIQETNK